MNFGPAETVPAKFRSRYPYCHNPSVTLMRTTPEECAAIGRIMALKLNRTTGSVTVLIFPYKGFPRSTSPGEPFYSQEAINTYRDALKQALSPTIKVVECDAHINDEEFARFASEAMTNYQAREVIGLIFSSVTGSHWSLLTLTYSQAVQRHPLRQREPPSAPRSSVMQRVYGALYQPMANSRQPQVSLWQC